MIHFFQSLMWYEKGHFFIRDFPISTPTLSKPQKIELHPMLNSFLSFRSRDMKFILFCSDFSTLQ